MIERWQERARTEAARVEARAVIERWNAALAAGKGTLWSPTIRAAVLADMPWLDVHCPGCGPAGRSTFARSTGTRSRRSAASCSVCGVRGAAARPQCRG